MDGHVDPGYCPTCGHPDEICYAQHTCVNWWQTALVLHLIGAVAPDLPGQER